MARYHYSKQGRYTGKSVGGWEHLFLQLWPVFLGIFALYLVVEFWYVAAPLALGAGALLIWRKQRRRRRAE